MRAQYLEVVCISAARALSLFRNLLLLLLPSESNRALSKMSRWEKGKERANEEIKKKKKSEPTTSTEVLLLQQNPWGEMERGGWKGKSFFSLFPFSARGILMDSFFFRPSQHSARLGATEGGRGGGGGFSKRKEQPYRGGKNPAEDPLFALLRKQNCPDPL